MKGHDMTDVPDLIDAQEVARLLHISPRHLTGRVAHRPDFPRAFRPGNKRLWDRADVLRWLHGTKEAA